jgi:hypothetical protein
VSPEEVYDAWAPDDGLWSEWVKPVLFASMADELSSEHVEIAMKWHEVAARVRVRGALVVDLPGADGVELGLALSDVGYRPVPLYNAVPFANALVALYDVMSSLSHGARRLGQLPATAPPAFLLDSLRVRRRPVPNEVPYDNRWVVRSTDLPSGPKLASSGIRQVLLIRRTLERPEPDLEEVLLRWQRQGLELWHVATDDERPAQRYEMGRRPWCQRLLHAITLEPRPRSDGAYGRFVSHGG